MTASAGMQTGTARKRFMPSLLVWAYRRSVIMWIYRCLPRRWRERITRLFTDRLTRNITFRRGTRWTAAAEAATDDAKPLRCRSHYGAQAGVNIYAFASAPFGLGEGARLYTRALASEGYPVAVHNIELAASLALRDRSLEKYEGYPLRHDIDLLFVNPDFMEHALNSVERSALSDRYTIACWFWELERFPDAWRSSLGLVDEFLVSSSYMRDLLRRETDKPVLLAPLPLLPVVDSGLGRGDFGLHEDAFLFLCTFDFNSSFWRKNPLATVAAFRKAFQDTDANVQLLIKSTNGRGYPEALSQLLESASGDDRILLRDDLIEKCHMQALQRCADAYVSLHRAEGFGLGIAEAMALGKPAIATAWSGNMEYMNEQNSCLVDFSMVSVPRGQYPHSEDQRWAEPDIEHAASLMYRLAMDRDHARRIGERAANDIRSKLSPHAIAAKITDRLQAIKQHKYS